MTLSQQQIDLAIAQIIADLVGHRDDVCSLTAKAQSYCTATLRDPRELYEAGAREEMAQILSGIISGRCWPTDRGVCPGALMEHWYGIMHLSLHLALGHCPDDEN